MVRSKSKLRRRTEDTRIMNLITLLIVKADHVESWARHFLFPAIIFSRRKPFSAFVSQKLSIIL